ncbi:hypothetical protein A2572_00945 [Candidatus Collierbacteria bacterium RIFOXYD1_FULL_40_9]|uniref:Uncharacterized protein n=1 Tax=Candidatus Collierbacteria bacterium RIFOXYD1_FULL_40_9 TaxID=1817731 RepID=A0A1F5FVY6_9BACT|nr:MAG: hypothetical protein A2572_00945 [Candidatus Collierbacteria bacterium RIFOXYD1_FULL_40_9]
MEELIGFNITFDLVVSLLVKVSLILLSILSLIMVRQTGLMNRVVNYPIGGSLKALVWGFAFTCLLITVIVVLV